MADDLLTQARNHSWWYSDQNLATQLIDLVTQYETEIERLRGLFTLQTDQDATLNKARITKWENERELLSAEIERLRDAYEQERRDCINLTEKVVPNLRDEIERLRRDVALLDRIRANPFSAIDKILAAVDVDTPAKWSAQVDEALGE